MLSRSNDGNFPLCEKWKDIFEKSIGNFVLGIFNFVMVWLFRELRENKIILQYNFIGDDTS
jgi:hypothetical protein